MFITFEGIEGSGKSTHLRHPAEHLRASGRRVVEPREPGGTAAGAAIRRLLLGPDAAPLTPLAELFLYCADRTQHVQEVIRPALDAGQLVLCDRFSDSTLAYQGYARGLDLEAVRAPAAPAPGGGGPGPPLPPPRPRGGGGARPPRRARPGARLLCAAPGAAGACGACAHCTRAGAGTHPDLHLVARDPERRDIRIEQVRELTRWLALQPLMAARKVGVLDDAHCLSEQAQNALLKTLEEPPGSAVLVLVASSAALLLPTVRSRCQVVRLEPLPAAEAVRVLAASGVPAEQAGELAALAEGS